VYYGVVIEFFILKQFTFESDFVMSIEVLTRWVGHTSSETNIFIKYRILKYNIKASFQKDVSQD